MDLTLLAQTIAVLIAPLLPELLSQSETLLEEAEAGIMPTVRGTAQSIWRRIHPKMAESEPASGALQMMLARPEDTRARSALEIHIEELLAEDPELAHDLAQIVGTDLATAPLRIPAPDQRAKIGAATGDLRRAILDADLDARTALVLLAGLDVVDVEMRSHEPSCEIVASKVAAIALLSRRTRAKTAPDDPLEGAITRLEDAVARAFTQESESSS